MSKGAARVGDTISGTCNHGAICCPHNVTGVIISGSDNVTMNGRNVARVGDFVEHSCPHCGTGTITTGSNKTTINGKALARLGDTVTFPGGSGTITSASGDGSTE